MKASIIVLNNRFSRAVFLVFALILLLLTGCNPNKDGRVDLSLLERGVNLSALEDEQKPCEYLFDGNTYKNISKKGFDHVRLPVDFRRYADENGNLDGQRMKDIDKIIEMANESGLIVFLDFHGWQSLNVANGDDLFFNAIWKNLAERYKDYAHNDMLVFELLNEPREIMGCDLDLQNLDKLICTAADIIREISPDRTLCFPTADANNPSTLKNLEYSFDFRDTRMMEYDNVIVAAHIYAPFEWTHQNFEWAGRGGRFAYLDAFNISELKMALKDMADFKKETGIPVILGEFGFNTVDCTEADQILYMQTVVDCMNKNDIPCTWWHYTHGEMSVYENGSWNDTLADIMLK